MYFYSGYGNKCDLDYTHRTAAGRGPRSRTGTRTASAAHDDRRPAGGGAGPGERAAAVATATRARTRTTTPCSTTSRWSARSRSAAVDGLPVTFAGTQRRCARRARASLYIDGGQHGRPGRSRTSPGSRSSTSRVYDDERRAGERGVDRVGQRGAGPDPGRVAAGRHGHGGPGDPGGWHRPRCVLRIGFPRGWATRAT